MKSIKRTGAALLALSMCMSGSVFAKGKIFVDMEEVKSDTPPQVINDRTMVPVRAISEMLGYDVKWIEEKEQVEVYEKDLATPVITMNIDNTKATYLAYDEEKKDYVSVDAVLDSPATLINDRTFVPLRFISEAVGYTVDYDEANEDVYMYSPEYNAADKALTDEELKYVSEQTTEDWVAMSDDEKIELVQLIADWWNENGDTVEDEDAAIVKAIDEKMQEYKKDNKDEYVFDTACELYKIDATKYVKEDSAEQTTEETTDEAADKTTEETEAEK